jgi:hypothetical protein
MNRVSLFGLSVDRNLDFPLYKAKQSQMLCWRRKKTKIFFHSKLSHKLSFVCSFDWHSIIHEHGPATSEAYKPQRDRNTNRLILILLSQTSFSLALAHGLRFPPFLERNFLLFLKSIGIAKATTSLTSLERHTLHTNQFSLRTVFFFFLQFERRRRKNIREEKKIRRSKKHSFGALHFIIKNYFSVCRKRLVCVLFW